MEVINLGDGDMKCPKCKTVWLGDCFTTQMETPGKFLPKCGKCGYVYKDV